MTDLKNTAREIVGAVLDGEKNGATSAMMCGAVLKELQIIRRAALKEAAEVLDKLLAERTFLDADQISDVVTEIEKLGEE